MLDMLEHALLVCNTTCAHRVLHEISHPARESCNVVGIANVTRREQASDKY